MTEMRGIQNPAFDSADLDSACDGRSNRLDVCINQLSVKTTQKENAMKDGRGLAETKTKEALQDIHIDVDSPLLFKVSDTPPISMTIFFGLQQTLLSISSSMIVPFLVADAVCAKENSDLILKLISSTLFMNGVTTFMQSVFGIRLPLFQGPTSSYIVPLLSLNEMDTGRCSVSSLYPRASNESMHNVSSAELQDLQELLVDTRLRELMGPLMLIGLVHFLIGATGLAGTLLRFIGPVTIVPAILLIGIYIVKPLMKYAEVHWGVSFFTMAIALILSLYLGSRPMPIPFFTRKKGCHIIWYPLHQVFALLIAVLAGWSLCAVLTSCGVFTDDKNNIQYKARTDYRSDVISTSPWIYFPYPGHLGSPLFGTAALIGFLIATLISILDSIGDYYAAAAMCRVPPPPKHGINRGIAIEGFCSLLSGAVGCGHATTTYGGNIGAIGMTKVASRSVFAVVGIFYMAFGVLSKVSAIFVSIPYPVLGGTVALGVGVFIGVNLSNLKGVDLASTRNLSIMGISIFVGLMVPRWMEKNGEAIETGNEDLDQVIRVILGNPNFIGSFMACFLDNTVPGTDEERGIAVWRNKEKSTKEDSNITYLEGKHVYDPLLPQSLLRSRIMKYIPIFPYKDPKKENAKQEF